MNGSLLVDVRDASVNSVFVEIQKENYMLYTIAVILLILWLLGVVSGYTISGFIHILIVIAIVTVLLRVISGRRVI